MGVRSVVAEVDGWVFRGRLGLIGAAVETIVCGAAPVLVRFRNTMSPGADSERI